MPLSLPYSIVSNSQVPTAVKGVELHQEVRLMRHHPRIYLPQWASLQDYLAGPFHWITLMSAYLSIFLGFSFS